LLNPTPHMANPSAHTKNLLLLSECLSWYSLSLFTKSYYRPVVTVKQLFDEIRLLWGS